MGYQKLVDFIRDAAVAVNTNGTFIHGRRSDGSLEYDGNFPQIHLYPFRSQLDNDNKAVSTSNILMGFWMQDEPDSTNEEREEKIATMDTLSDSFLDQLDESQIEITDLVKEPQYRTLSGTLSGYAISFRAKIYKSPC